MIPHILQLHWLWDNPAPFIDGVIRRWKEMLPDWTIMVIRSIPDDFPTEFRRFLNEPRIPSANRADLFRNWSMWRYGGIYVDADTLPVRPFDEALLNHRCFIPYCSKSPRPDAATFIDSCLLGSEPHHPFWGHVLDNCRHPEAWISPGQWFCGVNTFQGYEKYGVSCLPYLCRETVATEVKRFVADSYSFEVSYGPEYLVHFRASLLMDALKILPSHWQNNTTWRMVYGKYPYEIDPSICRWPNLRIEDEMQWGISRESTDDNASY